MSGFAERFIEQGKQKRIQQGLEQERLVHTFRGPL
jgi:hypothetical protein